MTEPLLRQKVVIVYYDPVTDTVAVDPGSASPVEVRGILDMAVDAMSGTYEPEEEETE
jgi:hypothetical protein